MVRTGDDSFKNGMLPIQLSEAEVRLLMDDAKAAGELTVDLPSQTITRPNGDKIAFEVDAFRKHCLLNGLDDIGLTMLKGDKIGTFEKAYESRASWMFNK